LEPLVSVLIPAYNAASTLAETLASVCGQTHRNLDIIVVDDGSADDTFALASRLSLDDPRIRLLRQDNAGVAAARNLALRHAAGPLVAAVDADDLWHATKIERQVRRLREAADAAVVYCWSIEIDSASRVIERRLDQDEFEGDVYAALVLANFVGNGSVPLLRRDLAMAIGGWDPSLRARKAQGCEDWQFYLRLAERARFALEPAFLVGYRQSPNAMSRQLATMRRSYNLVMREVSDRRPRPPSAFLRWSRAEFGLYEADLLLESGDRLRALGSVTLATLLAPTVVGLASYKHRLRRIFAPPAVIAQGAAAQILTRKLVPAGVHKPAPRRGDPFIGRPFLETPVERDFRIRDGAVRDRTRSKAARLKLGPG
ncbi:MAG: glycosyltransferase family A protein, partial [Roseiarcus sp.]|uniref:glycosyltransferase family 2 protein n=1 Tax=Roseiarcus sp. TaxID=1969460 RepID=UPI003C329DFA